MEVRRQKSASYDRQGRRAARATGAAVIKRLQRRLRQIARDARRPEAEQRRRAEVVLDALAGVPAAILIADNRGRYIDANGAATRLTGYSRGELLRMSVWTLTPGVRLPLGRRLWREFLERGRMSGIYQIRRKNGRIVRPRYVAAANILPGIHVSALVAESRRRSSEKRSR